jgi:hypothetical protein
MSLWVYEGNDTFAISIFINKTIADNQISLLKSRVANSDISILLGVVHKWG